MPSPSAWTRPWLLATALAAGCGGPERPDLHAAFAQIQVEEARIEHAGGEAPDCASTCEAADRICEIAAPTGDRDALARCERARARCVSCVPVEAP